MNILFDLFIAVLTIAAIIASLYGLFCLTMMVIAGNGLAKVIALGIVVVAASTALGFLLDKN